MKPFDLTAKAANGLQRGITTGTCATAAVKAALLYLLYNLRSDVVRVTLPDGSHFVPLEITELEKADSEKAAAAVIKNAGDDPDQTHRACIRAAVSRNRGKGIRFLRGNGVGQVTQPGLTIAIGEPAINPTPREMMRQAVQEVLEEAELLEEANFDITVGCDNGEAIAGRTFNPRLGIEGGISILGTSGLVEPKSLASFRASIEIYIRVALGDAPEEIVLAPGNLGQRFARESLNLPTKQVVQISNFVGFSLDYVEQVLESNQTFLSRLWLIGHPGKLAKLLDGVWDTHSQQGTNPVESVLNAARRFHLDRALLEAGEGQRTVEGLIGAWEGHPAVERFWLQLEEAITEQVRDRLPRVNEVATRLFQMNGAPLAGREHKAVGAHESKWEGGHR